MAKWDNRDTAKFKADETAFYSECQIYTSRIEECRKTQDNTYLPDKERDEAREMKKNLENERQMLIDDWKEKYGQYDEDKARRTRIDGSKVVGGYGNYWVLAEQERENAECECDEEEDYGM